MESCESFDRAIPHQQRDFWHSDDIWQMCRKSRVVNVFIEQFCPSATLDNMLKHIFKHLPGIFCWSHTLYKFYATWKVWFRNYDSSLTTGKDVCKSAWDLLFVPYPLQLHMSQFLCHICITIGKYNVQKKLGLWKFWLSNFASRNSRNIDKDIYRYFCPESFSIWGPSSFELVFMWDLFQKSW